MENNNNPFSRRKRVSLERGAGGAELDLTMISKISHRLMHFKEAENRHRWPT